MLKELFSNRLFIGALAFFVLCVGGSLLYMHYDMQRSAVEFAKDQEQIKQLTERQTPQPKAETPVVDPSQGGHFHEDGTWHGEPHTVEVPVEPPAVAPSEPYFSDAELAEIPEDMLEPDIPLPADLKNVDLDTWKQWRDKHQAEWNKYIHALDPAIERLGREVKRLSTEMPPESSPDYTAVLAKYNAKMLEYDRLITEKGWRIHDANDARQSASDKYRLARFGKK